MAGPQSEPTEEPAPPSQRFLDRVVHAASEVLSWASSKLSPPPLLEVPYWVANALCPLLNRLRRLENTKPRTLIYLGSLTTLPQTQSVAFWQRRGFDISVCQNDILEPSNRPFSTEKHCTFVMACPNKPQAVSSIFDKVVPSYSRSAVLVPSTLLHCVKPSLDSFQYVAISKPFCLLDNKKGLLSTSKPTLQYTWVLKGFRLPKQHLTYTHPGLLLSPDGGFSWACTQTSEKELQPSNQQSGVALLAADNPSLIPEDFQLLCEKFKQNIIKPDQSCSHWASLEAAFQRFLDRPFLNLTWAAIPCLQAAFDHALKGQSLSLGLPCTSCKRLCSPNSPTSCVQDSFRVCSVLLHHSSTPFSLQLCVLRYLNTIVHKCGVQPSFSATLHHCILSHEFLFRLHPNKKVFRSFRLLATRLLSDADLGREAWTYIVDVINKTRDARITPPPSCLLFLKERLAKDSVLLDGGDIVIQDSVRRFFLQAEHALGFVDTANTILPGGHSDMWESSECLIPNPRDPSTPTVSHLSWNVNGLASRWKSNTFQQSIASAGYPDILILTETRIRSLAARNLPGFQTWRRTHGYHHCYWHWSSVSQNKGGAGYGGICVMSRIKASHVHFGLPGYCQPEEARVITTIFPSYVLFATYSPNSGSKDNCRFLTKRLQFDEALLHHMTTVLAAHPEKSHILGGDLNVAPLDSDYHPHVFSSIPTTVDPTSPTYRKGFCPSVSIQERSSYAKILTQFASVNLGEHLDNGTKTKTWFPHAGVSSRIKGFGARLDHFLGPHSLLDDLSTVRALSVQTLWRLGNSDHVPILLVLALPRPDVDSSPHVQPSTYSLAHTPTFNSDLALLTDGFALPSLCDHQTLFDSPAKSLAISDVDFVPTDSSPAASSDTDYSCCATIPHPSHPSSQKLFRDVCDQECRNSPWVTTDVLAALESHTPSSVTQPMPFVKLHLTDVHTPNPSSPLVKVLLDSGSKFNLLNPELAATLTSNGLASRVSSTHLPSLQAANGQVEKASAALTIEFRVPGFYTSPVTKLFYVLPSLPIPAIMGSTTFRQMRCSIDWDTNTWSFNPLHGPRVSAPFVVEEGPYWQASAVLTTLAVPVVIPAGSHAKIPVRFANNFKRSFATSEEVHPIISNLPGMPPHLKVGVGISNSSPSWIQMSNTSSSAVTLPPLSPVACFQYLPSLWYSVESDHDLDATAFLCDHADGTTNPSILPNQWSLAVDAMPDSEIDAELSKKPLDDVDFKSLLPLHDQSAISLLKRWVVKRKQTFSDGTFVPTKPVHRTTMHIQTTTENPPLRSYPYRMSPSDCEVVRKQITDWKKNGVIQDSISPWSSNVVLVRHPDKKPRVAIDYRKLNSCTVKDAYMLPRVDHVFDVMNGVRFVSVTDCHSAFLQIPIADARSRELTAFVAPDGGLYEFLRCPFGLVNAPSVWQRLIDNVMAGYKWKFALTYVDDICIFTKSADLKDHIADLDRVFNRLDRHGLCVKASKTFLARTELPFLGHLIGTDGIKPDPRKVAAISEMPLPTSLKQLRSALGTFSYYRKFVNKFSAIAAPLTRLMAKDQSSKRCVGDAIAYTPDQTQAFQNLKSALTSEPVCLAHPDWSIPFEVHCDASKDGLGAVLCQKTGQGEKVVMYASRSTTPLEKTNYSPYELEACALVWSTNVFRHYLYGRKFIVNTDHQALKWLKTHKNPTSRIHRWVMHLLEYDFDVVHRSGTSNSNADGLSRNPLASTTPYNEDPVAPLYMGLQVIDRVMAVTRSGRSYSEPSSTSSAPSEPSSSQPSLPADVPNPSPPPAPALDEPLPPSALPYQRVHNLSHQFFSAVDRVAWEKDTFIRLQNEDPLLRELRKEAIACSNLESSAACRFKVNDDGLLVLKAVTPPLAPAVRTRKRKRNRALPSWAKKDRIVVPETLKAFVLYLHHGLPLSGHQGRTRTLASISERFWWSGLSKDVRRWVRSCVPCLRRKSPRPLRSGLAQTMAVPHPAHTFAIDLVGPCPETAEGDVWILTIIDVFTRWPIAIPLPNRKATTIQRALYERLFSVFGFPVRLLSDRGKEFIDGGLHSLCAWLGIQKIATTGYQPQANGHIERFHRYLNSSMTSLASGNITKWSFYIPAILFSYRVSSCLRILWIQPLFSDVRTSSFPSFRSLAGFIPTSVH